VTVRRILVVRLSALGDVVFASPLIRSLRSRWPDSHIAWLVEPAAASLLTEHPELNEVLVWDKTRWKTLWRQRQFRQLWREVREFRTRLRQGHFDLVLDIQGLLKSAVLAWFTGARSRIGFISKEWTGPLLTHRLAKRADTRHIGSEYRGIAEDLGLSTEDFAMEVGLSETDRAVADAERDKGRYAVFAPFTTRPQKHWQMAYWRQLGALIQERWGLRVVILGGPGDIEEARALVADTAMENLAGTLSLRESAAIIAEAELLVGVDTGLTHMGTAFERPTVALFGSTVPYRETSSPLTRIIYHDLACAPCRRKPTCNGRYECMTGIGPEEVMDVIGTLPITETV